jgi:hypothetical protein
MDPDVASLSLTVDQHMQALMKDAVVSAMLCTLGVMTVGYAMVHHAHDEQYCFC